MRELSLQQARQIAVRAQLLDRTRPTDLVEVVRHLTFLQADPTAAVVPSADLVLWSRLGSSYDRSDLEDALVDGELIELGGLIRPREDLALFRAQMAAWPGTHQLQGWEQQRVDWVEANRGCRLDILDRLRADGPLPSRELPDTCVVPWRSSGWNNNRNLDRMLAVLVERGEVAYAGRDGRDRLWDLAERVYPDDEVPLEQALRTREVRTLRALGVARNVDAGEPVRIAGLKGRWRVDPDQLDRDFEGRCALLSPLDRLVFDRKRMTDLFAFDYQLEMYKPAAARRWGYWALPVLYGDELIGKVDASADRQARVLRVHAVHRDSSWSKAVDRAVGAEVQALADWLELELELPA